MSRPKMEPQQASSKDKEVDAGFVDAIKKLLKKNGYYNKVKADIQANITELLQHRNAKKHDSKVPHPSNEVLMVNNLVREYLEWNGYLYSCSVFMSEAAMPKHKITRTELCEAIGVKDDEKSLALPLLTNIVAAYTERIKRRMNKVKPDTARNQAPGKEIVLQN